MSENRDSHRKVDCARCGDSREVVCGDGFTRFCGSCPKPCRRCDGVDMSDGMIRGTGYCAKAPCLCVCHKLPETSRRALEYMRARRDGVTAGELGAHLWPERKGHIVSSNGGGDYAAQMLLGRLRKAGFVYVMSGEGSSRWDVR